ncbi:MAPEG family protein [Brevundimonas diminuta]|uniref:MAPEG family protein n=1 Tax=Brevundimonas diminuta TaxID=293 RepID=UPI003F811D48
MTTELTYLAATLVLALIQIMLPAAARDLKFGLKWGFGTRDHTPGTTGPIVARLDRAQANLFETLPLFIGAVLIAQVADRTGALTALGRRPLLLGARRLYPALRPGRSLYPVAGVAGLARGTGDVPSGPFHPSLI